MMLLALAALAAAAAATALDVAGGGGATRTRATRGPSLPPGAVGRGGAGSRAAAPAMGRAGAATGRAGVSSNAPGHAGGGFRQTVAEVRDPEEAKSFPVPAQALANRRAAASPAKAAETFVAPGALSTTQVRHELARLQALERAQEAGQTTVAGGDSVGGDGAIPIPPGVPAVIQKVIAGANAITDYPYVYGGGHASFVDNAYDCSGSVSYALAAGGLVPAPETSGALESWGVAGPGQWITVYANAGHVYMYVNIGGGVWMRYDTVGRSGPYASRWQPNGRSNEGFLARHWPGL